ncbi:hypothetical protein ACA910_003296 [Epithemia clementina (nom. ined.)]
MHCLEHHLDLSHLPPLGFAFCTEPFDESSDGSFEFYVSACSTFHSRQSAVFSLGRSSYDHPPRGSAPMPQAWSTSLPPSVIHAAPISSTDSPILQEAFDRVTRENDRLSRDLRALSEKVQLLLNASQSRESASASTSAPGLSPADIEKIVLATTQSVLAALQQALASARISGASTNHLFGPESLTRSHEVDMSFDSEMLPSDGAA